MWHSHRCLDPIQELHHPPHLKLRIWRIQRYVLCVCSMQKYPSYALVDIFSEEIGCFFSPLKMHRLPAIWCFPLFHCAQQHRCPRERWENLERPSCGKISFSCGWDLKEMWYRQGKFYREKSIWAILETFMVVYAFLYKIIFDASTDSLNECIVKYSF